MSDAAAPPASARDLAQGARRASRQLQALTSEERSAMLLRVADALVAHEAEIMAENAKVRVVDRQRLSGRDRRKKSKARRRRHRARARPPSPSLPAKPPNDTKTNQDVEEIFDQLKNGELVRFDQ